MVLIIALVAVIALSASSCNDGPDIEPVPEAPPAPVLASGEYRLTVVEAHALDCQGAGPEDFTGQQAWGYLDASRAEPEGPVVFELEGIPLTGTMVPGALSVGGSLLVDGDEPRAEETDEDVDYADTGADPSRGGGSSSGSSGGGSTGHGEPDEPPAYEAWATLEANIQAGNHAMGILVVSSPGCAYELNVSMDLVEDRVDTGYVGIPEEDTGDVHASEGDYGDEG